MEEEEKETARDRIMNKFNEIVDKDSEI